MIHYNVPTMQYDYALGERDPTDYLRLELKPSARAAGLAILHLSALSPGRPAGPERGTLSLTHVRVSIEAPGCEIVDFSPGEPFVETAAIVGDTAFWEQQGAAVGSEFDYSIEYQALTGGTSHFEFRVQAAELKQPIRLAVDVPLRPEAL